MLKQKTLAPRTITVLLKELRRAQQAGRADEILDRLPSVLREGMAGALDLERMNRE